MTKPSPPVTLMRRTLQDSVYLNLRLALMSGEFTPGQRLTAREIAESRGTSAMPVREAFRQLIAQGALEPLSTGATRVPIMDSGKIADVMEIRLQVEDLAVRRTATRITEEQLRELTLVNDEMAAAQRRQDPKEEARANERFHFCIYRAAGSEELLRVIEHLWLRIGPYLYSLIEGRDSPPRTRRPAVYHTAIMDALKQQDPDKAAAALREDLTETAAFFSSRSSTRRKGI